MGPATSGPGGPGTGGEVRPEIQPTCAHLDPDNANLLTMTTLSISEYEIIGLLVPCYGGPEGCVRRDPATRETPGRYNESRKHERTLLGCIGAFNPCTGGSISGTSTGLQVAFGIATDQVSAFDQRRPCIFANSLPFEAGSPPAGWST